MAKITDVFVSGTMENIVLYTRLGTRCARIRRTGIKQTAATKIRSINFGIASRAAKALRSGLNAVIPFPANRSMQSRFSGSIAKWLGISNVEELAPCDDPGYINAFQFTNGSTFKERFKVPITITNSKDNLVTVAVNAFVPSLNVTAPAGTVFIELVIAVGGCMLATGMPTGSETQRIQASFNDNEVAAQSLNFNVSSPAGSLTVTAAWLQYYIMKNNRIFRTEDSSFIPAGVVNASYC